MRWRDFLIGLAIGLWIGLIAYAFVGNRYDVKNFGYSVKIDRLTGKTWKLYRGFWRPISNPQVYISQDKETGEKLEIMWYSETPPTKQEFNEILEKERNKEDPHMK